ncbi:MAG: NAD+ synthase, partial [Pseudomonadota bacterium]
MTIQPDVIRIALAQLNPTVGDIEGNKARIAEAHRAAADAGADLVVYPELTVSGYPPEDLTLRPAYASACRAAVEALAPPLTRDGPALILNSPWPDPQVHGDNRPFNAIVLCDDGRPAHIRYKEKLPNYGVFDEPRTFQPGDGSDADVYDFKGLKLGLLVCEDMWYPAPAARLAAVGADLFIAPHGSPFRMRGPKRRIEQATARVTETGRPLIFVNQVGGQDELVFDGGAFVAQPDGEVLRAPQFTESIVLTEWARSSAGWRCTDGPAARWVEGDALMYHALVIGTRDYVRKSGFSKVVLGLSGGIDSAMVAAICVDALGAENVRCVMMPSRYTSRESLEDAAACAERLGVPYETVGIERGVAAFDEMLRDSFSGYSPDVTEENIQSRLRGVILMAMSNKFGALLMTTGNKSEMAVGYATLYGDMNGAYNPLKDVYKTKVFALARWRNTCRPEGALGPEGNVIPER